MTLDTTRLRELASRYHDSDTIEQHVTDELVNALPELLNHVDQTNDVLDSRATLRSQVDRLTVDNELHSRTINDLENQVRVLKADLAAAVATA